MHNAPRVILTPATVGADPDDVALCEKELAEAHTLGTAEDIEAAQDSLDYARTQVATVFTATIGDASFEVDTFAIEHVDGRAVMTLQFEVGSLQLGDLSTGEPAPEVRPAVPAESDGPAVWGKPGPDPREKIAGWSPEQASGLRTYGDPVVNG